MSSPISRHFPIFYSPTSQILRLSLVFLLLLSLSVDSFSRGAPESACEEDMRPRHGFATQVFRISDFHISGHLEIRVAKHETWVWAQNRLSTWRVIYLCKHGFVSWNICLHLFPWPTLAGGRICVHILFCLNATTLTGWWRLMTCRLFCGKRQSNTLWLSSLGSFVGNVNILI